MASFTKLLITPRALTLCLSAAATLTPMTQPVEACQPGMPEMEGRWMDGRSWKSVELLSWDETKGRYAVRWPLRQDLCLGLESPYYGSAENSPTGSERIPACFRYPWEVRATAPMIRMCGKAPTGKVEDIVDPQNMELTVADGTWLSKENSAIGSDIDHAGEWMSKNLTGSANVGSVLGVVIFIAAVVVLWALYQVAFNQKDLERREACGDASAANGTLRKYSGGGSKKFAWSHTAAELTREMAKVMGKLKMMKPPLNRGPFRSASKGRGHKGWEPKGKAVDLEAGNGSYIKEKGFNWSKGAAKKQTEKTTSDAESMSYGAKIVTEARKNPYHAAVATFFHGFKIGGQDNNAHKVSPADLELGVATGMVSAAEAGMEKKTKAQRAQEGLQKTTPPRGGGEGAAKRREHAPSRSPARISNVSTQLPCSRENTPRQRARTPEHDRLGSRDHTPLELKRSKSQPPRPLANGEKRRCHSARDPVVTMTKMDLGPQHDLPHFGRRGGAVELQQKRKRVNRSLTPPRWDEDRMQYTTAPKKPQTVELARKSAALRAMEKEGLVNNVAKAEKKKEAPPVQAKMSEWEKLMA